MGRLSVIVLFTQELARQREFYEKSLGLSAASASERWLQFGTRDAALALRALEAGVPPRIELGFDVGALDAHLAQLKARGVSPKDKPEESADCRIARVQDPDGNVVQLVERKKPTTAGTWPRLSHAIVNAKSFEACVAFYHDALGFRFAEEREHWVEFDTGGTRLTLHASRNADGLPLSPDQKVAFALMDDDLDAWADELRERGVRFATTPTEEELGRMAEVEDADGWFVVLRGPAPEVPIEESLAADYADEDGTRIEQIRKTADTEPGARPAFGSRKLARKKIERVATKGFDAMQKTKEAEGARGDRGSGGGFTPGGAGGSSRPFTPRPPRPEGSRPFTPRPEGSRPFTPREDRPPRPEGARPFTPDRPPRPEGSRPFTPRPGGSSGGPRPFTPRPEGSRPSSPPRRDGGPGGPPRRDGGPGGGPRPSGPRPGGPRRDDR